MLSVLILGGCDTFSYYQQMGQGHFNLMNKRELISSRLHKAGISAEEKRKLELVVAARDFASKQLYLPANKSYQHYSDLKRPHVTWNVIATAPLSMSPEPSCFPIIGCLSYRGYFKQSDAQQYANKLSQRGLETYIAGSSAYSTLGWFADPVVSTMLRYDDFFLLETLFHELAHQKMYFANDSEFNEAFATAVGQYGVRKWLSVHGSKQDIQNHELYLKRRKAFTDMLRNTADRLRRVFEQKGKTEKQKVEEKQEVYKNLAMEYKKYRLDQNFHGYDSWFLKPVNNPRLAIVSTYHDLVPEFINHLEKCHYDLPRFYRSIATLRSLSPDSRKDLLLEDVACTVK